jgi:phospholipid/cholesterol/gamma-HCH transport system substrate-binding protein
MGSKREDALVGIFVLVAAGLLIATVFLLSGSMTRGYVSFHTFVKNAGGISPGAEVRYGGGPPVGRVTQVHPDPKDSRRMEIEFSVKPETPVKSDCEVRIASTSPLGDNYLGINCDKAQKGPATPGQELQAAKYSSFSDISDSLADLTPQAKELLANLNDRVTQLKVTIDRVNDLINDRNRQNLSASLADIHGMLAENRPAIRSTVSNLNSSSAKVDKLLDDFKKTMAKATDAIDHIDGMIVENRPDLRKALIDLRHSLANASDMTDQLDHLLATNSDNLDEIIDNLRHVTANLREFTETIKTHPSTLIRSSAPKEHEPGKALPQ